MPPIARLLPFSVLGLAFVAGAAPAQSAQLLWSNPWSNYTTVPSRSWTNPASDLEAADDFDLQATITRVVVDANGCFQCAAPTVTGATVRFYAWNNGMPGALLQEQFVPAGSPNLLYVTSLPETVDVTLPVPFLASGRHFVSLQMHFQGGGYWDIWVSGVGAPTLAQLRVRDRLAGTPWTHATVSQWSTQMLVADLTFQLFGQPVGGGGSVAVPCSTWSELPTAMPANADYCLLRAVKTFGHYDAWAVGSAMIDSLGNSDQVTVTMHWDGSTWTQIPSPSPTPAPGLTNCILYGLDGVATNDLWAAGTYQRQVPGGWVGQQVFAMHWDGASWTVPPGLPIPATSTGAGVSGSRIFDVDARASDDVWFAGDWLDIVSASSGQTTRPGFLMHWDGSALAQTVLPIVTGVGHQFFSSISAASANDVWVAGGAGVVGTLPGSSVPVLFRFDGSQWTHTPCTVPSHPGWWVNLHHVQALSANDVWVFGASQTQLPTSQYEPFVSRWNGSTWTLLPSPPVGAVEYEVVSPTEVYAVGTAVWRFDGAAWTQTQQFTAQFGAGLNAVDSHASCGVIAAGGQSRIGQIAPFVMRLDAAGYAHSQVRLPSQQARAPGSLVAVIPPHVGGLAYVAIDDPSGALGAASAMTLWALATAPAPGYPAPVLIPFGGTNGAPGELFVDPMAIGYSPPLVPWTSAGPTTQFLQIPNQPALIGASLYTQAALLDLAATLRLVFTNGLDLYLGQ